MASTPGTKRSISMAELADGSDRSLIWHGSRIANAPPSSLWAGASSLSDHEENRYTLFLDDFLQQASATASALLFEGTEHGDFTGVGLPHFFIAATENWNGARAIISGDADADHNNITDSDEIDALPDGSALANIMMPDYAAIWAGARECAKG